MRRWREQEYEKNLTPKAQRRGLALWAWLAKRPTLYHLATGLAARVLARAGRKRGAFSRLPLAGGWTAARDLPAPEGATFRAQWKGRRT